MHFLGVAQLGNRHSGRQISQARQGPRLGIDFAQSALTQFHFQHHVAVTVEAGDLRRSAVHTDVGHLRQHHRATLAGYGQAPDRGQVRAHRIGQLHANRHLALRQVELGQRRIVVTGGGHAHRLANAGRRHTQVGGARVVGPHNDFGTHQRGAGIDIAYALEVAQLPLHQLGRLHQGLRVFTLEHQLQFAAGLRRAHVKTRARNLGHASANLGVNVLHALFAIVAVHRANGQHRAARFGCGAGRKRIATGATAYRAEDANDMRYVGNLFARLLGDALGLRQGAAGRQFDSDLRLPPVTRRDKGGR